MQKNKENFLYENGSKKRTHLLPIDDHLHDWLYMQCAFDLNGHKNCIAYGYVGVYLKTCFILSAQAFDTIKSSKWLFKNPITQSVQSSTLVTGYIHADSR